MVDKRKSLSPGRARRTTAHDLCPHVGMLPELPDGEILEGVAMAAKVMDEDGTFSWRLWKTSTLNDHEAAFWLRLHADKMMQPWNDYADSVLSSGGPTVEDE
jgi:hypothetical protein